VGLFTLLGVIGICGCGAQSKGPPPTKVGGRPISEWADEVKSTNPDIRFRALNHLGNAGAVNPTEAFPAVVSALKDPEVKVRREAIRNMLKFRDNKPAEAIAALNDVKEHDQEPKLRSDADAIIKAIQEK
jgi:HEAT repeat protein